MFLRLQALAWIIAYGLEYVDLGDAACKGSSGNKFEQLSKNPVALDDCKAYCDNDEDCIGLTFWHAGYTPNNCFLLFLAPPATWTGWTYSAGGNGALPIQAGTDGRGSCWEKRRAQCVQIASTTGFCGTGRVYDTSKASTNCASSACTTSDDEATCCRAGAFCTVPSIPNGVRQWTGGMQCASGSSSVLEGTSCLITSETGYTCTSPGLCGSDGNFASVASCQALCIVPDIPIGVDTWSGSNCGSGSSNVAVGIECQITATIGYVCVSPGLCGAGGNFANIASCQALCTVPEIPVGIQTWNGANCGSGSSNVVAGADCQIIAANGYTCVSPGLCGSDRSFANIGFCGESTATSTTIFTTTLLVQKLQGSLRIEVANAKDFVNEPNVTTLFRHAIAKLFDVIISWIRDVRVTLRGSSRLLASAVLKEHILGHQSLRNSRYLFDETEVDVTWTIEIPPEQDTVIVNVLVEDYNKKTVSEITSTINTLISAGMLGDPYDLNVTWNYAWVPEPETGETTQPSDDDSGSLMVAVIIAASSGVLLLTVALLLMAIRRRGYARLGKSKTKPGAKRPFAEIAGPLANTSLDELMCPPPEISQTKGKDVEQLMLAIAECQSKPAKVFITYAVDSRTEDADGFGPGFFYVAALSKFLYENGIPSFCDLMVDECDTHANRRLVFSGLLSGSGLGFSECELLIVVLSEALFNCKHCLRDIYSAQENKVNIFPLRFEHPIPNERKPWPQIERHEVENLLMVSAVEGGFCKLNSIPSPPYTVRDQPEVLRDMLVDLKELLGYDLVLASKQPPVSQVAGMSTLASIRESISSREVVAGELVGRLNEKTPLYDSTESKGSADSTSSPDRDSQPSNADRDSQPSSADRDSQPMKASKSDATFKKAAIKSIKSTDTLTIKASKSDATNKKVDSRRGKPTSGQKGSPSRQSVKPRTTSVPRVTKEKSRLLAGTGSDEPKNRSVYQV